MKKTPNGAHTALVPWLACFAALLFGANFLLFLHDQASKHENRMVWCPHHGWHSGDMLAHPVVLPFEGDDAVWQEEEIAVEVAINDHEVAIRRSIEDLQGILEAVEMVVNDQQDAEVVVLQ